MKTNLVLVLFILSNICIINQAIAELTVNPNSEFYLRIDFENPEVGEFKDYYILRESDVRQITIPGFEKVGDNSVVYESKSIWEEGIKEFVGFVDNLGLPFKLYDYIYGKKVKLMDLVGIVTKTNGNDIPLNGAVAVARLSDQLKDVIRDNYAISLKEAVKETTYYRNIKISDPIIIPPRTTLKIYIPLKSLSEEKTFDLNLKIPYYLWEGDKTWANAKLYKKEKIFEEKISVIKDSNIDSKTKENLADDLSTELIIEIRKTSIPSTKNINSEAIDFNNEGSDLMHLGKYGEAIKLFEAAIEIDPEYSAAWNNKGVALGQIGKDEEGIKCLYQAAHIDPGNEVVWTSLGVGLLKLKEYEKAIDSFEKAIAINPQYAEYWNNIGIAYSMTGANEKAIEAFDRAIKIDPQYKISRIDKEIALIRLGRYRDALSELINGFEIKKVGI